MAYENQSIETYSEAETIAFAARFAQQLNAGDIVLLYGDLGMGKTVFSRALIRALCTDEAMDVPSPTFTLVQTYDAPRGAIWHFDLYRLSDPSEIYEIGWEEALSEGMILVEWPERLNEGMVPSDAIKISLSAHQDNPDQRTIEITKHA
tara:strand:- start:8382 stop:8828 length:447 start_codon:yes stop_codon:yes gene_type:complete